MFGNRYFAARFFADRYWPPGSAEETTTTDPTQYQRIAATDLDYDRYTVGVDSDYDRLFIDSADYDRLSTSDSTYTRTAPATSSYGRY